MPGGSLVGQFIQLRQRHPCESAVGLNLQHLALENYTYFLFPQSPLNGSKNKAPNTRTIATTNKVIIRASP